MKTIYIKKDLFSFSELDEAAKSRAIQTYIDITRTTEEFEILACDILREALPGSEKLNIQFDFSCRQGAGVNIYGIFNLRKYIEIWRGTEQEREILKYAFSDLKDWDFNFFKLSENMRYYYSMKSHDKKEITYFSSDFLENLDEIPQNCEGALKCILEKFLFDFLDFLESIETDIYNAGDNFFYDLESISQEAESYFSDFGIYFNGKGEVEPF